MNNGGSELWNATARSPPFVLWMRGVRCKRFHLLSPCFTQFLVELALKSQMSSFYTLRRFAAVWAVFWQILLFLRINVKIWPKTAPEKPFSKWRVILIVKKLGLSYLKHVLFVSVQQRVGLVLSRKPWWGGPFQKPLPEISIRLWREGLGARAGGKTCRISLKLSRNLEYSISKL